MTASLTAGGGGGGDSLPVLYLLQSTTSTGMFCRGAGMSIDLLISHSSYLVEGGYIPYQAARAVGIYNGIYNGIYVYLLCICLFECVPVVYLFI